MNKEETAGTKTQEYYWEQEKQLFAIRRFFYKHNLLPKDDSYFPDDVINRVKLLQAENKELKARNANQVEKLKDLEANPEEKPLGTEMADALDKIIEPKPPKCRICNDSGVYEHTIVTGEKIPVRCFHDSIRYY